MRKPLAQLTSESKAVFNPVVILLDDYRVNREEEILARLVTKFNSETLDEKTAFLAVAEIAALRNMIHKLST